MPFDGTDFHGRRNPPRRATSGDNLATFIIVLVAFGLLVMPISLTVLVDIARYMDAH